MTKCRHLRALTHVGKMLRFTRFYAYWQNVAIYALLRMLAKCHDLGAFTHVGKMLRFTHFARHKILAARHFQLFCTTAFECVYKCFYRREITCCKCYDSWARIGIAETGEKLQQGRCVSHRRKWLAEKKRLKSPFE